MKEMGLKVKQDTLNRKEIKTAQEGQKLSVLGQVKVGGLVGNMNVSSAASCNLISIAW